MLIQKVYPRCKGCNSAHTACHRRLGGDTGALQWKCVRCEEKSIACRRSGSSPVLQTTNAGSSRNTSSATRTSQNTSSVRSFPGLSYVSAIPSTPRSPAQGIFRRLLAPEDPSIIGIGLDFGTKNLSASWGLIPDPRTIKDIDPVNVNFKGSHRLPVEIGVGGDLDGESRIYCGHEVDEQLRNRNLSEHNVFRLMKLGLVPEVERRFEIDQPLLLRIQKSHQDTLESISPLKSAFLFFESRGVDEKLCLNTMNDVLIYFLRYTLDQIKIVLQSSTGLSMEEIQAVVENKTKVAIAAPAIWTYEMLDNFEHLAVQAGIPVAACVSEPQCVAAVVADKEKKMIEAIEDEERKAVVETDLINLLKLFIDVGHGTADLSVCRIDQYTPAISIREEVIGTGSLCGSERLHHLFQQKVREIFGDLLPNYLARIGSTENPMTERDFFDCLTKSFEKIKERFDGSSGKYFIRFVSDTHSFSAMAGLPIEHNALVLSLQQMKEIFDDFMNDIIVLVERQVHLVKMSPALNQYTLDIHTTGGGSLPPYFRKSLLAAFRGRYEVIDSEMTEYRVVAKGAFKLLSIDTNRIIRTAYGTEMNEKWDRTNPLHLPEDKLPAEHCNYKFEVANRIQWAVNVGHELSPAEEFDLQGVIYLVLSTPAFPLTITSTIWKCDDPVLGIIDGLDVTKYPEIIELKTLPVKLERSECAFEEHQEDGEKYFQIDFKVILRWDRGRLHWRFVMPYNGTFRTDGRTERLIIRETSLVPALRHEAHAGQQALLEQAQL